MKKFRPWLLAAAALTLCAGPVFAQAPDDQGGPPPGGPPNGEMGRRANPERELHMLTRVLTLTPEQQTGVKALLEQQASQMQALRGQAGSATPENGTPETRRARRAQMEQIRDDTNTKITALLDDNQKKLFADWTARRKAAMERHQPREGNPPPDSTGPGRI